MFLDEELSDPNLTEQDHSTPEAAERISAALAIRSLSGLAAHLVDSEVWDLLEEKMRKIPGHQLPSGTYVLVFNSEKHVHGVNTDVHLDWIIQVAERVHEIFIEKGVSPMPFARLIVNWWPSTCDGFYMSISAKNMLRPASLGLRIDYDFASYVECARFKDDDC
jgi:hypothetical protein